MQALRNASFLARLVLAWFALSVGVAVGSPVIKTQGMEMVCSGAGGMKLLVSGEGGEQATLDCPLCVSLDAPPFATWAAHAQGPARDVARSFPARTVVALMAAPPPARGPPLFA